MNKEEEKNQEKETKNKKVKVDFLINKKIKEDIKVYKKPFKDVFKNKEISKYIRETFPIVNDIMYRTSVFVEYIFRNPQSKLREEWTEKGFMHENVFKCFIKQTSKNYWKKNKQMEEEFNEYHEKYEKSLPIYDITYATNLLSQAGLEMDKNLNQIINVNGEKMLKKLLRLKNVNETEIDEKNKNTEEVNEMVDQLLKKNDCEDEVFKQLISQEKNLNFTLMKKP